ncbi:glycosyltransferase [Labilibaculum antarcticum]|uniref:Glycosyl transferase n=1 Tax=Labilibaculum antarcticum TaxID=1717717 RepID=A0A1Y1CE80_9BACT|nr:glycosyltransferase [Labilibaculum antarcticum]BAX78635.1 glycosyl transferase [Labilibaculum antarcticum]
MKILHITLDFGDGGAEKFVVHLSNEQVKQNDVTVCSFWDLREEDYFHNQLHPNVKFISLGKRKGFDIAIFLKVYRLLKEVKPDIVHSHRSVVNYLVLFTILFKNIRFIHTIHNDAFKETQSRLIRFVKNIFFKVGLIRPVTISEDSHKSFKAAYSSNATLIYNGIPMPTKSSHFDDVKKEVNKLKISINTKVLLNIARISTQKNHELLVNVTNRLIDEGYDIVLLVIGKLDKSIIDDRSMSNDRINFLGSKGNATDYLFFADAFCLSSLYEGMPISLIEALAVSCVPVVTPAGGVKDMITDKLNGFISSGFGYNSYHETLKTFLNSESELVQEIKNHCIMDYEKIYNISNTNQNYLKLYEQG